MKSPPASVRPRMAASALLTHLTRASSTLSALDNLTRILGEQRIRASTRMIRGRREVVCLFDARLEELARMVGRAARRRYEPFGIALRRSYAYAKGARPVIYLPWAEAQAILPSQERWRVVNLELDSARAVDWTFEREWRLVGDLPFTARDVLVLVPDWQDVDFIYERFDGRPPCAGVVPLRALVATTT